MTTDTTGSAYDRPPAHSNEVLAQPDAPCGELLRRHGHPIAVEGHCLDQPCEPDHVRHRDGARQPGSRRRSAMVWGSPTLDRPISAHRFPLMTILRHSRPGNPVAQSGGLWCHGR